jgi:hypothetical protein
VTIRIQVRKDGREALATTTFIQRLRFPNRRRFLRLHRGIFAPSKCRPFDRIAPVVEKLFTGAAAVFEFDAGVLDDPESPISLKPPLNLPPKKRQRSRQQRQYRRQAAGFVCWNAIAHFERLSGTLGATLIVSSRSPWPFSRGPLFSRQPSALTRCRAQRSALQRLW